ncbi:hypothetical protein [Neobacillus dielmonensis]|uniref:hypothetical protein n=1 Tax=Neobacillus dielmonensis TaxID=1347369 RepID=UPI0005A980BB|nr:hypothetical protein [Neobacillus dielmonensis]
MGFLKGLGAGAGWLVGNVTGGIIKGVGEITHSDFIRDVGEGVKNSTEFAGKQLGNLAEGVWNVGSGLITKDDSKINQGFDDLGEGVSKTAKAVGQGISATVSNIGDVAGGLMDGNSDRALAGAKNLGKSALIVALGVSILDMADIVDIDGNEGGADGGHNGQVAMGDESIEVENPNQHDVTPHWRTLSDGREIWVDGDGDTTINRSIEDGGGWTQTNPNYEIPTEEKA